MRDQIAETGLDVRTGDAERIAALGVSASRVPVLWERVAPADPHDHDFSEPAAPARRIARSRHRTDRHACSITAAVRGTRICSIPRSRYWFAEYAEATARAFPWVRRWTPINEPLTTARFATLYGVWYPNVRDDRAFGRAMVNQTLAQQAAMRRIRRVIPDAEFVLTEDLQRYTAGDAGVAEYVAFLRERVYLSVELVAGRVGDEHPLTAFLTERCGVNAARTSDDAARRGVPDLVAFNHYPHSERYLFTQGDASGRRAGRLRRRRAGAGSRSAVARRGRAAAVAASARRGRTCTHRQRNACAGSRSMRPTCDALRADGVDLRALGAWAAFGMVDWHSLLRRRAALARTASTRSPGPNGVPQPTAVAGALRELAATGSYRRRRRPRLVGARRSRAIARRR